MFGTPILLALDYELLKILGVLLPSSLLVSLIQIWFLRTSAPPSSRTFLESIVGVLFGATLLVFFAVPLFVYILTASAMLLAGCLRFSGKLRCLVGKFLDKPSLKFHFLNGFFHGFSNLGGILLVLKNSLNSPDKNQALNNTASIYLIYVLPQMAVLFVSGNYEVFADGLIVASIVAGFSLILGIRPINFLSTRLIDNALGLFFVSVSIVLFYKISLLIWDV